MSERPTSPKAGKKPAMPQQRTAGSLVVPEVFELIIRCDGEQHQRTLYHRLTAEGLKCRLSIL
jgi:hypothetical protein